MSDSMTICATCPRCGMTPVVAIDCKGNEEGIGEVYMAASARQYDISRVPGEYVRNGTVRFGRCVCADKQKSTTLTLEV